MVNTLAALVCGGHIVELKGSIPCSNNIVYFQKLIIRKKKKIHIGFINNIDDNEMKYFQSVIESQKTKYRFWDFCIEHKFSSFFN